MAQQLILGPKTLSIRAFSITTFSIRTFNITTTIIRALNITFK